MADALRSGTSMIASYKNIRTETTGRVSIGTARCGSAINQEEVSFLETPFLTVDADPTYAFFLLVLESGTGEQVKVRGDGYHADYVRSFRITADTRRDVVLAAVTEEATIMGMLRRIAGLN